MPSKFDRPPEPIDVSGLIGIFSQEVKGRAVVPQIVHLWGLPLRDVRDHPSDGGTAVATAAAGSLFVGPNFPGASGAPSFNTNPTIFALGIGSTSGQSFRIDSVTDAASSLSASTTYAGGVAVAKTLWAKDVKCDTLGAWAVPYADAALKLQPAALGVSGSALMSNGSSLAPTFRTPTIPNRLFFGAGSGTYTPTTGCIYFYVEMGGGGGAGGERGKN